MPAKQSVTVGQQEDRHDRYHKMLEIKALSQAATAEVQRFIDDQPVTASSARMSFILRFVETVGLRLAKLLGAKLQDLRLQTAGWDAPGP